MPWTSAENDQIVADYFEMLKADIAGRYYNKAEHNRNLQERINRERGAIEYKHQNISAVLMTLGEPWIPGYKPAFNFQMSLVDAVLRWLSDDKEYLHTLPDVSNVTGVRDTVEFQVGPPPTPGSQLAREEFKKTREVTRYCDVAGRIERNRILGNAGEERVFSYERATLMAADRYDLAEQVRWVSRDEGDGAGYDIASFSPDGKPRLIEVKTTNGWERTPFYITRNELAVAERKPDEWQLLRLWNFARTPRAFELHPPLDKYVSLDATSYQASFL